MKHPLASMRCRLTRTQLLRLLTPIAFVPVLHAADVFKADNADALNLTSSWVGGALPTTEDVAVFDSTVTSIAPDGTTGRRYMPFPVASSWKGIRVNNAVDGLSLDTWNGSAYGLQALTLGSAGIDMSAAASGTTFELDRPTVALLGATVQTWNVADTTTLQVNGSLTFNAGTLLKLNPNNTGAIAVGATITGNLPAIIGTGNTTDFASVLAETTPVARNVLARSSSVSTNPANPAPDATNVLPTPTNTGGVIVDFRTQYTTDGVTPMQGITVPNGWFFGGFRFSVPNLRTDLNQWTVNYSSTTGTRTITPGIGVVVTEGVGTDNVVFAGPWYFRIDNTNRLILHQDNPSGDLIFRNYAIQAGNPVGGINARNGAAAHIVKSGRGRVIVETPVSANNGLYLYEGTFQVGPNGSLGTGPVFNSGSLVVDRSTDLTISSLISGIGTLTKSGTGNLTLSGANTYTGNTTVNGGSIVLGNATALGEGNLVLAGGGITFSSGITPDFSLKSGGVARSVTLSAGPSTINTNGTNVTLSSTIGQGGSGSLTKAGSGTLTFAAGNTYTGTTTVSGGTLALANASGSATGTGDISVAGASTLTGAGTSSGTVSLASGATLVPGNAGVGNLTLGGLTLASGSVIDFEFASTSSYDQVTTTRSNGLTINGGGLHLYQSGSSTAWSTPGTYNLIPYVGAIQGAGPSALQVLNPAAGYGYTFGSSSGNLTLTIALDSILSQWTSSGSGSWNNAGNWSNGIPNGSYTAQFTTDLGAPATVTLDGNRTVNATVFTSANGYTVAQGTGGTLTYQKASGNAAVNVNSGSHVISAPVAFSSTVAITVADGSSITYSGSVSGSGGVIKSGAGTLDFTGANSFTGAINATGGVLGFAQASSLGTGAISLDGAILRYDTGNTADISSRSLTFGFAGATVDTNGNNVTLANAIGNGGTGALTKTGTGTLTLNGVNTYTGGTVISQGTLAINSNAALGDAAASLTLNGGVLAPASTLALDNAGANPRNITVTSATGSGISVASGNTLTVSGAVSGTGAIAKDGAGTLLLSGNNSSFTGGFNLSTGSITAGGLQANGQQGLGTGPITFGNNTSLNLNGFGLPQNATSYGSLANALNVPAGVTANLNLPTRLTINSALTGTDPTGTINVSIAGGIGTGRQDFQGNWGAFAGRINLNGSGDFRISNFQTSVFNAADLHVGSGVRIFQNFNPPTGTATQTIQNVGALSGDSGSELSGNLVPGRFVNWSVGASNTNTTFAGVISDLNSPNFAGYGQTRLTKVGTGVLTLSGANTFSGGTTIDNGVLNVTGSILGRPVTTVPVPPDGVLTEFPAAVGDVTVSGPGSVPGGTLAGNGSIAGTVNVNGTLRPAATGAIGGQLTFVGALNLAGTTQFDFDGTVFTGVKSTLDGGVNLGGALKLNVLGTIYNGSYTLFEFTGSHGGSFSGVTVTTTTTTDAALTDSGGTWTGTVDGASFSFNASTGVLTVTGGANAVLPATPGGVSATAGNAQVTLNWSAAANASSYLVKRSTTAGGPYATVTSSVVTTSYVDTGLTNGTTYYYVIQAKNSAGLSGNSAEVSATPQASTLTGLQNWRQTYFGTTDNLGNAADSADPDSDGIPNLIEYATNRNPTAANTSPVLDIGSSGGFLTVTYTSIDDDNLTYTVQGVNDIAGTPVWATVAQRTGAANIAGPVTITDTQAISASARRFLRLNVSYTP